ncbi:dipeptide ABC transporter ATP-binding protein [Brevibacterium samyangense]|uniref:ABC transporter ATP-binding protein n=1 Tax=Brevibacterium samyangense TaxID=366888 RepID=A0ABP5ENT4_9MICO
MTQAPATTPATGRARNVIEVANLKKEFTVRSPLGLRTGSVKAVAGVSFALREGETLGVVGESGCGKSTTGRLVQSLITPTSGSVTFMGKDLDTASKAERREYQAAVQMIFQDPYSSLNPRKRIGSILEEALRIHGVRDRKVLKARVIEVLETVGFSEEHYYRFPHEFSGGQRQRIGIARALMVNPKVIVCDEPVSALDVSIQSQVLNLLRKLQREKNLTYMFISHDLSVVKYIADRVAVMYLGKIVELAPTKELYASPKHPYTKALLSAVPVHHPRDKKDREILQGDVPSPLNPPSGCVFRTRCPMAMEVCAQKEPTTVTLEGNHQVACHLFTEEATHKAIHSGSGAGSPAYASEAPRS